jgi:short-subunit dehydrogenase
MTLKKTMSLKGKRIVVTGAAKGLGRSIAKRLVKHEDAIVIAIDIDNVRLKKLYENLSVEKPGAIKIITADLSSTEEIRNIYSEITNDSEVYGLINNAGITDYGSTSSKRIDKYQKIVEINFLATMKLSLLFLDHFKENNQGFIYNITSLTGLLPMAYQNIYSASKHAIQSFTYALNDETSHKEIFIGMFAPGGIKTSMFIESGLSEHFDGKNVGMMSPDKVSEKVVGKIKKRVLFSTSSLFDSLCILSIRIFPGSLSRNVMRRIYKPENN